MSERYGYARNVCVTGLVLRWEYLAFLQLTQECIRVTLHCLQKQHANVGDGFDFSSDGFISVRMRR
jgi:hypothetical protein